MEEHAWASYSANLKLLGRRSFRNLSKNVNYKVKLTKKSSNKLAEQRLNKIGQQTQKRTWLTVGLMLVVAVSLFIFWLSLVFL